MADTRYSDMVPGETGNYQWPVRFDLTKGGFLGISQFEEDGKTFKERVLLSSRQVRALMGFMKPRKKVSR